MKVPPTGGREGVGIGGSSSLWEVDILHTRPVDQTPYRLPDSIGLTIAAIAMNTNKSTLVSTISSELVDNPNDPAHT